MLDIVDYDHVGIRVADKNRSIEFYQNLGYAVLSDSGFEKGHPVILKHPSGLILNILGPAKDKTDVNVLMDLDEKFSGYTHVALHINSAADAEALMGQLNVPITGRHEFTGISTIFVRDPDRNVIELVEHNGPDPFLTQ
jgi:catechol 2,3-dioxygenase-like lactoylglutathione lyase family enzyme